MAVEIEVHVNCELFRTYFDLWTAEDAKRLLSGCGASFHLRLVRAVFTSGSLLFVLVALAPKG